MIISNEIPWCVHLVWVGFHLIFTGEWIFFCWGAKFGRWAEQCEGIWVCKGVCALITGACYVLQDTRELLIREATTMAPSSAAEQRALTFEHSPGAQEHKHPSSMTSCQPRAVFGTGETGVLTSAVEGRLILFPSLSSIAELLPEGLFCQCSWRIYNLWVSNL